jgi:hypothetical protein
MRSVTKTIKQGNISELPEVAHLFPAVPCPSSFSSVLIYRAETALIPSTGVLTSFPFINQVFPLSLCFYITSA